MLCGPDRCVSVERTRARGTCSQRSPGGTARPIRAPAGTPRMAPIAALPRAVHVPRVTISMNCPVHVSPRTNPIATPARRPNPAPRIAHLPLEWRPPLRSMRITSWRGTTTALGCPSAARANSLPRNDWITPTRGLLPRVRANTRRRVPGTRGPASSPRKLVPPIKSNAAATTGKVVKEDLPLCKRIPDHGRAQPELCPSSTKFNVMTYQSMARFRCKRHAARQPSGNMAFRRGVTLKLDQRLSTTTSKRAQDKVGGVTRGPLPGR